MTEPQEIPGNLLAQIRVQATGEARDADGRVLDANGEPPTQDDTETDKT